MREHLTSQQVTDWRSGVTGAEEILRLDDHLAECADCRALISSQTAESVRVLCNEFSSDHLTEAQLDDYAQQRLLPADVLQHLDLCAECRADAEDLREFEAANRTEAPAPGQSKAATPVAIRRGLPVWALSAAALAVAAVGVSVWFAINRQKPAPQGVTASAEHGVPPLVEMASAIPPAYRDEVNSAMNSGTVHLPDSIAGMSTAPVQLRSVEVRHPIFHVTAPLATAVLEDTPLFRWTPVEGATYTVSVYDDQFQLVETGSALKVTEWRPQKPLARGAVYRWQVRAVKGGHAESAPAPTEAEARFLVMPQADAEKLQAARAAMPNASLAMGILYANAGAVEDAKRELTAAAAGGDPKQKSLAEHLLDQLKLVQSN